MTRIIALTLAIATGAAMAAASDKGSTLAADDARAVAISELLTSQGYEVQKIETEGTGFEAYALKDGTRWEIELNADLAIVETERDDD